MYSLGGGGAPREADTCLPSPLNRVHLKSDVAGESLQAMNKKTLGTFA